MLMCKGKPEEKAEVLFDMIIGPKQETRNKDDEITWLDSRLIYVVR